jgi:hypothetical protein
MIGSTNLNANTFNKRTRFYILLDYWPHKGYLKKLSSKIRGGKYHNVQMVHDCIQTNLESVLASVEVMILGLENGFDNHGIVVSFKI